MKKVLAILVVVMYSIAGMGQKTTSDITISYDNTVETTNSDPKLANMFNGATTTIYIKGLNHRTEQVNRLGTSTTIYDGKNKKAAILKEYGKQKLLVKLTEANWKDMNKKNESITFTKTSETKTVAGYSCTKSIGKLNDGSELVIYTTTEIIPENKEYNTQFKNADGLVLQYEITVKTSKGSTKVTTTASKVALTPVAITKFEIPKEGYREMTYEESLL